MGIKVINFFNGLNRIRAAFRNIYMRSASEELLFQYFKKKDKSKSKSKSNNVILVQCVEDIYYFGLFGQVVASLCEQHEFRVEQYILRSLNVDESKSFFRFLVSRLFVNALLVKKWIVMYNAFCNGVGYCSTSSRPVGDVIDGCRAWKSWRNIPDKYSLIKMQIDGVVVGDLINDSFLRFKPAPTVRLKDFYLWILIWQAYRDIRRAKYYFSRVKPIFYLTSYSTYIQHGVPVRVALQYGVKVFSFGNYQEFNKRLSVDDWVHTRCPDGYAKEFTSLNHPMERLAMAESALSARLAGAVDSATAYMKKSAYVETGEPVPNVRGSLIVFLHDFYDSPHCYQRMVFPDFWEWICFTIETLMKEKIPFFVKPHPNQIGLSDKVLIELKRRYPGMPLIPSSITNKQLVNAGMSCAVTVHGTVAHEMAYLGVPTIACGHNPHINFEFCRTAHTRDEYFDLLKSSICWKMDEAVLRQQSLIFYYMHNFSITEEMKDVRNVLAYFRTACERADADRKLIDSLNEIATQVRRKAMLFSIIKS